MENKMKKYTLTVNEDQLFVISRALETYSRLGTKQYSIVMCEVEPDSNDKILDHNDRKSIEEYIRNKEKIDLHPNASYGINESMVSERFKSSWDLYQVIRYTMSWAKAEHKPEERDEFFHKYITVNYDKPMKTSIHPLARCEVVEDNEYELDPRFD